MELWTRDEHGRWKRWRHPGPALDALAIADPKIEGLVALGSGPEDEEELIAAIRLARRLQPGPLSVIAGTEHPSARWYGMVCRAGVDRALFVSPPGGCGREQPPLADAVELGAGICPALHVQHDPRGALSVCGQRGDAMVLARQHLARWCVVAPSRCPHAPAGPRG
jgi:hypothetical protein